MAFSSCVTIAILLFQIYANAAPSDLKKLEGIAKVEQADFKLDSEIQTPIEDIQKESNSTQGQRQKRWFNFYGYGFPPINPVIYPNIGRRDDFSNTGAHGYEDPLANIHRRLQEIAGFIRQPVAQPPPSAFPVLFPVIFIPQYGCPCIPPQTETPNNNNPTSPSTDAPQVTNRFPEMDDPRQNWGIVINETDIGEDEGEDVGRPISFVPIRLNRTMTRPAPPVDHGSVQGGEPSTTTTTTVRPAPNPQRPTAQGPRVLPPNACDTAVLSCCHQVQVTYECFVTQGCTDPTSYGNPCDSKVILKVIDRFQRYHSQRLG